MDKLLLKIYDILPDEWIKKIGKSKSLEPLRNLVLRKNGKFREGMVNVEREYLNHKVKFKFYAQIVIANRGKVKGIENKLLRNSMKLLEEKGMSRDAHVFDVGANFGYLSLVWANSVCKDNGKIYSFEPNPRISSSIEKSIKENGLADIMKLEKKAVGNQNGKVLINASNETSNLVTTHKKWIKVEVDIVTLDNYVIENKIQKCDLIKIDVDGIEYDILQGAIEMIKRFKPILIIETNNDKRIVEFLRNLNYEIMDSELNSNFSDKDIPVNIFCKIKDS